MTLSARTHTGSIVEVITAGDLHIWNAAGVYTSGLVCHGRFWCGTGDVVHLCHEVQDAGQECPVHHRSCRPGDHGQIETNIWFSGSPWQVRRLPRTRNFHTVLSSNVSSELSSDVPSWQVFTTAVGPSMACGLRSWLIFGRLLLYSERHGRGPAQHYSFGAVAELRPHARLLPLRHDGRQERPWHLHPFPGDTLLPPVARSVWAPHSCRGDSPSSWAHHLRQLHVLCLRLCCLQVARLPMSGSRGGCCPVPRVRFVLTVVSVH